MELERLEEKKLGQSSESWKLDELRSALKNVSDVEWFEGNGGMLNVRMLGPQRPSTFRRVFSRVPGAIYSCLKVCTTRERGKRGFFLAINLERIEVLSIFSWPYLHGKGLFLIGHSPHPKLCPLPIGDGFGRLSAYIMVTLVLFARHVSLI